MFTGDIMCDNHNVMSKNNYSNFIDKGITKRLIAADYTVGNLEVPIVQEIRHNMPKYAFSAPIKFAQSLKDAGINFVSTANNHCLDCGINGLEENIENLDALNIEHTGTYRTLSDSNKVFIKNLKGTKVAFLSYTYGTNAFINHNYLKQEDLFRVDLLKKQEHSHSLIRKLKNKICENASFFSYRRDKVYLHRLENKIKTAKRNADITVVCLHTGGQYNKHIEHYTKKLCKHISQLGVDLIIANHPHVVLKAKKICNTLVFYSLGNFFATPYSNHNQKDDFPDTSIAVTIIIDQEAKQIVGIEYSIVKTTIDKAPICRNIADIYYSSSENDKKHLQEIIQRVNRILGNKDEAVKYSYKLEVS